MHFELGRYGHVLVKTAVLNHENLVNLVKAWKESGIMEKSPRMTVALVTTGPEQITLEDLFAACDSVRSMISEVFGSEVVCEMYLQRLKITNYYK